jgi:hypothetical protein
MARTHCNTPLVLAYVHVKHSKKFPSVFRNISLPKKKGVLSLLFKREQDITPYIGIRSLPYLKDGNPPTPHDLHMFRFFDKISLMLYNGLKPG